MNQKRRQRKLVHTYVTGPIGGPRVRMRVTEVPQCPAKQRVFSDRKCQGARGHDGPHWCYREDGWLEQWQSKKDIKGPWDWAHSSTPPGHKDYPDPVEQAKKHYRAFSKYEKVQDLPPEPIDAQTKRLLKRFARHEKMQKKHERSVAQLG